MRRILYFLLCVLLFTMYGCTNMVVLTQEDKDLITKAKNSRYLVLDVYQKRCESCKYIEPVLKKIEEYYSNNPKVVFLKDDLSNSFSALKSLKIAEELGLGDIYRSQRYTGVVLIIDTRSKVVLESLIAEYSYDKYIEFINRRFNGP